MHRCDWHMWQPVGWEFCWRCEEITREHNKKKYESVNCNNNLQRVGGNQTTPTVPIGEQKDSGRDSDTL